MSKEIQTKHCLNVNCKSVLPATTEYFYRNKSTKDGLSCWCKQCQKQEVKRSYQRNKEYILQRKKFYNEQYYPRYYKTLNGYLRHIWKAMLTRCNKPKCKAYKYYGGRGIKVNFGCFEEFFNYVVNVLKVDPRGLTIDRINNNGHYEAGNIRFVSQTENCRNRRR